MNRFNQNALSLSLKKARQLNIQLCLTAIAVVGATIAPNFVRAQTPTDIPSELQEVVSKIEKAANQQNLNRVMKYYDASFSNQDGLTVETVRTALEQMWANYPQLNYQTEITSWSQEGDELAAETLTSITGTKQEQGRTIRLESTLKARQYFRDRKLVRQEVLGEKTILTSGDRPPKVTVNLPETVKLGQKYAFDTIVEEPLEGNVLLGAAIEEQTASNLYLDPSSIELEPLTAGGIYKVVTAPRLEDNHWLSAIIVRGNGITMVTQRVRVKE